MANKTEFVSPAKSRSSNGIALPEERFFHLKFIEREIQKKYKIDDNNNMRAANEPRPRKLML